jgi:hypothetical protein
MGRSIDRRSRQRLGHPVARWWGDRAWPVLAGATLAVGTFGAVHAFGVGAVLSAWLGLTVLVLGTLLGVTADGKFTLGRVQRSCGAAGALVTLAGLASLFDGFGVALAVPVVLTSPALARLTARVVRSSSPPPAPPVHDMLADPQAVDTAFEAIVTQLEEPERHPDE